MLRDDYQMVRHVSARNMSSWCHLLAEMPSWPRRGERGGHFVWEPAGSALGGIPGLFPAQPGRDVMDRISTSAKVTGQNQWQSWGTTWTTSVESLPRTEHYAKPRTSSQQIWEEDTLLSHVPGKKSEGKKAWRDGRWVSSPLPFWYFPAVLQTRGHLVRHRVNPGSSLSGKNAATELHIWPCSPALRVWMETAGSLEREGILGTLASGGTKWFQRRQYLTLIRHPVLSISFFVNVRPASYLENMVPLWNTVETQQILAKWIVPKGNLETICPFSAINSPLPPKLSFIPPPPQSNMQHPTPPPLSNSMNVSKKLFSEADNFR